MAARDDPDPFAPDRGLQARMLVALALNGATLLALVGVAIWSSITLGYFWIFWLFVVGFGVAGAAAPATRGRRRSRRSRAPSSDDVDRVAEITRRLCIAADLRAPLVYVERDAAPLSWTVSAPWSASKVSVTTGLLDKLDDRELTAVIAHELMHVVHRDAIVMTLLAAPPIWLFRGMRALFDEDRFRALLAIAVYGTLTAIPAVVLVITSRFISRHRELAADRGAAELVGSAALLSSALRRISGELAGLPRQDLRIATARDPLHIVPARGGDQGGIRRLWATHPPLQRRLDQLERIERAMQR